FFQAEDGIRDRNVTGVQTCALPILTIITVPFLMKLLKKEVRIKGHFDIKGIILMSVGIVFFMLFTTSYSISFLIVSVLSFLIFVKHIRKVTDPFVDPG